MKAQDRQRLRRRKARIDRRLDGTCPWRARARCSGNRNLRYEVSGRVNATARGGIGLVHDFVRELGLPEAIDRNVVVLKRHFPYHESDHVLNLTYNLVTGGTCIEDIEKLRQDEAYLEVLGAQRVPDPTTAGDFLRRFDPDSLLGLAQAMNEVRPKVWASFPCASVRSAPSTWTARLRPRKVSARRAWGSRTRAIWGYHPLVVTLANTREVLDVTNRPGDELAPGSRLAPGPGEGSGALRRVRARALSGRHGLLAHGALRPLERGGCGVRVWLLGASGVGGSRRFAS